MHWLQPNLTPLGRWLRALLGVALLAGAVLAKGVPLVTAGLAIAGGFVLFEAWRGWCALRACGIKTRL